MMKKQLSILMSLAMLGLVLFTNCGEDEDPELLGSIEITIDGLNAGTAAGVMVEGPDGYTATVDASTTLSDLTLGLYTFTVETVDEGGARFVASESDITVNLTSDVPEMLEITFAEFSSINGIVGTWVSAGDNVASLLVTLFAVDSIVAVFNSNQTYTVEQYAGGSTTPLTLSGTFSQEDAGVNDIWNITVDQTSPAALTSQGIFAVDASMNPNSLQYEIAQTSPDIGAIPPNATDGFGSTSGGAFGTLNVQTYVRRSF
jgi:hypothetical protein